MKTAETLLKAVEHTSASYSTVRPDAIPLQEFFCGHAEHPFGGAVRLGVDWRHLDARLQ
jgi:hypothetical protein